jgi:hypothetical protein
MHALLALVFLLISSAAAAASPPATRPAYRDLRFDEDWSVLAEPAALPSRDPFDPIKYVELGDDVWASFGGQLRLRFESWDAYEFSDVSDPDEDLLLTRLLAHVDLHFGERARLFVEVKSAGSTDQHVFDDTRPLDVDWFDLQNGFLELAGESLRFRLGRQELAFARQRLVSPLDWANARRTFDGATLEWTRGDWHATGFATRPVRVRPDDGNDYRPDIETFYGVHATRSATSETARLDLYAYGIEKEDGDDRFFTLGGRVADTIGDTPFDYDLELSGQLGSDAFRAAMFASQLGWWLAEHTLSPRFFVGFDWASGGDDGVFNQLFPLGHAYFGAIDAIGRQNLLAASAGVSFRPLAAVSAELVFHQFWLDDPGSGLFAADGRQTRPGGSRHRVGAELDLVGKWQIDPHTALFAGYGHFFPGPFIDAADPSSATDFVYLALQYTF